MRGTPVANGSVPEVSVMSETGEGRGGTARFFVGIGALLLLLSIGMYFWFLHQYGVNAIWYDQWENVALLTHSKFLSNSYAGHTSLNMLWALHNENRMLFPNLIVLALGHFTHLNVLTEMYLSAVLLVIALVLIILTHRRDLGAPNVILYVPLAFLLLTLGQFGDTLFGFQLAWYLILLALAAVIFFLNTFRISWPLLLISMAIAVVASYSSLQGLLVWPAGLVVLLWRGPTRTMVATWLAAAVVTTAIYFYNYDFTETSDGRSYLMAHPLAVAKIFFFLIGDVMGRQLPANPGASDPLVLAAGIFIFLLAVVCLVMYARPGQLAKSPVGPALICFGLLFAATVAYGRSSSGLAEASQSRYVTFTLLTLAGCYLCLLERWPVHEKESLSATFALVVGAIRNPALPLPTIRRTWKPALLVALRGVAILLIAVEVQGGIENGIQNGPFVRNDFQYADLVAAHAACASNSLIESALFPNNAYKYSHVRALALAAKKDGLSFFATSEASQLEHIKLPQASDAQLRTSVVKPTNGAHLRGDVLLTASASANCAIKAVSFQIMGSGGQHLEMLHGARFAYGFLGDWSTKDVPNGVYTVRSTIRDASGATRTSRPIAVTVRN